MSVTSDPGGSGPPRADIPNADLAADLYSLARLTAGTPSVSGPIEPGWLYFTADEAALRNEAARYGVDVVETRAGDGWVNLRLDLPMRTSLRVSLVCLASRPRSVGSDRRAARIAAEERDDRDETEAQAAAELDDRRREAARGEL